MRRLSDYEGEAAIDIWAEIIEYVSVIFADPEVKKHAKDSKIGFAKTILKLHKKEVCDILLTIDPTPINGINIISRTVGLLNELGADPAVKDFFAMQGQKETKESSGSATVTTEEKEQ